MTEIKKGIVGNCRVVFVEDSKELSAMGIGYVEEAFEAEYLETYYIPRERETSLLLVGMGKNGIETPHQVKELTATACKELKSKKIYAFTFPVDRFRKEGKRSLLTACVETLWLMMTEAKNYKTDAVEKDWQIGITGLEEAEEGVLEEGKALAESIRFARDMVNMPSNYLRPLDFAGQVINLVKDLDVETEILEADRLRKMGMGGLLGVGEGSEFMPCLTVLRYKGNPDSEECTGLVGKGVTVDTGGYCIKPAASMKGIRGDMAGAAAVASAVAALAKGKAKVNVTAVLPMCENRISGRSFVDGDVLTSYSGKTVEIGNTDAEGRLILADAVTYAVRDEKVTRVLDIATLTGAVVNMLGLTIAGVLSDDDELWEEFSKASEMCGEKYWRLPFGEEHEKMIQSDVADIKNIGENFCGTITAGLFIRSFAEGCPWIHVDIAGTAWTDPPVYAYQERYATGNSVETLYYWLKSTSETF